MKLKSREKLLILFAGIAIAILIFDRVYYTPQNRRLSALRTEIKAVDLRLNEFLLMAKGVETVEAEIDRLEKQLKTLSGRTLRGEEFRAFLKHLAKESDPNQMKIISLTPQEEKFSPQEDKQETRLPYRKVNVQMILHSTYAKLGAYLREIEELPFLIEINNLHIEKNEEILPPLKVTMELSMYIISI
ncbi:MAG: type 4a pilus biogenesis protein PilO [Thermodesulfobacteriota bacterium]